MSTGCTGVEMTNLPRGILNQNPGNIRPLSHGLTWQGQIGVDTSGSDGAYVQFDNPRNGIRAIARIMMNYESVHGIHTLLQVFQRWAPSSDSNDPANYAGFVAKVLGVQISDTVDLHDPATLTAICQRITLMECGFPPDGSANWYTDQIFSDGVGYALGTVVEP